MTQKGRKTKRKVIHGWTRVNWKGMFCHHPNGEVRVPPIRSRKPPERFPSAKVKVTIEEVQEDKKRPWD